MELGLKGLARSIGGNLSLSIVRDELGLGIRLAKA